MPLALVAIGQTNALLVGGFDISVAALVTLCVVAASYTMAQGETWYLLFLGALVARRYRPRHRRVQRDADPGARPPLDHRDARDAQHPPGDIAAPSRPPRGPDQLVVCERHDDEHRLHADRLHRRPRARRALGSLAVPASRRSVHAGSRARRDFGPAPRDEHRPGRLPRLRPLLADGRRRRLLLRFADPDRVADHRRLRAPEHRGRGARRSEPRRRTRLVRRRGSRCPLPLADPERPAAAPGAHRVRADRDRGSHPSGADRLPGPRTAGGGSGAFSPTAGSPLLGARPLDLQPLLGTRRDDGEGSR